MNSLDGLKDLIEDIDELPTLPTVLIEINNLLQDPKTSSEEIGLAISNDQALASRVMKLVNSAFYGFPGRINTISHAISLLGFLTVRNVVITASIIGAFEDKDEGIGLDFKGFWLHSVATASIAKLIAKASKMQQTEEVFISALLHDLGKLLMQLYLPDEYEKVFSYLERKPDLLINAEQKVLGFDHTHAGFWLAKEWNLPSEICSVIEFHHDPMSAEKDKEICAVVNLADTLARSLQLGNGGDLFIPAIQSEVWDFLDMDESKLKLILQNAKGAVEKASIFMQVI
tara:strand:+ start:913 stop:1770 length:858 start_codon:yes stop_codon:yes gene_type:complete